MSYIEVPGGRVWYKIIGEQHDATPLLCLHGGPGFTHNYLEPLEALAGRRPVIFYDQLGCGNSDRPGDLSLWTVDRFVEELAQVRAASLRRMPAQPPGRDAPPHPRFPAGDHRGGEPPVFRRAARRVHERDERFSLITNGAASTRSRD
jgi:hypothetical protein